MPGSALTSLCRRARILVLVVALCYLYRDQKQHQHSFAEGCHVGPSGSTKTLSSLTSQQVPNRVFSSSTLDVWDFSDAGFSLLASSGQDFTMACLTVFNVSLSRPDGSAPVFLQPMAIDLINATGLIIEDALLSTSCSSVLEYQAYFCASYDVAGSIMLQKGTVYFASWDDGFTRLRNVTLTCAATAATQKPPCWLTSVQTAAELRDSFLYNLPLTETSTIVLAANISIDRRSWPDSLQVTVNSNVILVGSARLYRPILDFQLRVMLIDLQPGLEVTILNLTCANLAPTYISPAFPASIFSLLAERVWAFKRQDRQLYIANTTLVVSSEELSYMKHWLTYLSSPVPEDQAKASWLNIINIEVSSVNGSGVYYNRVVSYTTSFSNIHLTDSLNGFHLLPVESGLQHLLKDAVPLTSVRQVRNISDMQTSLAPGTMLPDGNGRRWLLLVANISLGTGNSSAISSAEPPQSSGSTATSNTSSADVLRLPDSSVIGIGSGLPSVRLDFTQHRNAVVVPAGGMLVLRMLVLAGLPSLSTAYDPRAALQVLVSPLWVMEMVDASSSGVRLENCSVLVSATELWLLQRALLPPGAQQLRPPPAVPVDDDLIGAAVRNFFSKSPRAASYNATYLRLVSGTTERYEFTNLTFRMAADGEPSALELVAPPGSGSGGRSAWDSKVGVIVGCVVGLVMLALAVAVLVLVARWKRGRRNAYVTATRRSCEEAYDKYLQRGSEQLQEGSPGGLAGSDGRADSGGGGGAQDSLYHLQLHPSNDLTSSSQVLRPDARLSGFELPRLKAVGSGAASTSASGGIGAAGPSASTTRIDISSSAMQPSRTHEGAMGDAVTVSNSNSGDGTSGATYLPMRPLCASPFAATASAAAAAAAVIAASGQVADSFERPPSDTVLGQHGPVAQLGQQRLSSVYLASSSSAAVQSQSLLNTGTTVALEQMHQIIQVLGRDFNDRQLEVQGLLGKGAHGTVYRGTWRGLPVAVKSMIVSNDSSARQQSRVLMEAAISSNLAHPNIVTTYSYELREVEHEFASISQELAKQGGGWRLLIIMEYCDAGPLRRLVDCGFFLTPPKPPSITTSAAASTSAGTRPKLKLPAIGLMRKELRFTEPGSASPVDAGIRSPAPTASANPSSCGSRGSSGNNSAHGNDNYSNRVAPGGVDSEVAATLRSSGPKALPHAAGSLQPGHAPQVQSNMSGQGPGLDQRPALDPVPADVPGRPTSSLQAARRYVEAALMIARGIQHIHDKNIVHGDLNPNNVLLVRAPGTPLGFYLKVADFGLSVRMAEGESHMSNLFQGSPYYCSPEVVLSGKVGKSADIYSLGIMLWELQNGTRPLWRAGGRIRSYPSLNTAELEFGLHAPPRYIRLTRECFHGSKDARPCIARIVEILVEIKEELDAL